MSDILENLTPPQAEAVTHLDGPMLVVAGAGSGKTRVVTRRIAYLIERGVWPNQILAMTFTNKAANEMKARVEALVGATPRWVSTFHSACARFLRRDIESLDDGRTSRYTIYDSSDQLTVIKRCLKELKMSSGEFNPSSVRQDISVLKSRFVDGLDGDIESVCCADIGPVYQLYERRMRELNGLDFDDLLLLTVRLLRSNAAVRDIYHARFRYLLIDEYQDTNRVQYELMKLLAGPANNVHATGDPDQSIYSWRGAEYRNIMDFTRDFPDARVVRLERNYRSTQRILAAANELIGFNSDRIEKALFTEKYEGPPVTVVKVVEDRDEASWVVNRVVALQAEGLALRDMAVFYRTNAQSRPLEDALMDAGVPYQVVGGTRFYERKEVKDALAHLHILINPCDSVSLQRVVGCRPTGVGEKTLSRILDSAAEQGVTPMELLVADDFADRYRGRMNQKLLDFAAWCRKLVAFPSMPVGDCIFDVIRHSKLPEHFEGMTDKDPLAENRVANLEALVDRGYEFQQQYPEAGLDVFLEQVALISDVDSHDSAADCLSLMTLHASKGLEFPYVFIVGVEEGYLPHENSLASQQALEEERRLLYVGITRAREAVYLLHVCMRYVWNELQMRVPSRFLDEVSLAEISSAEHVSGSARGGWYDW